MDPIESYRIDVVLPLPDVDVQSLYKKTRAFTWKLEGGHEREEVRPVWPRDVHLFRLKNLCDSVAVFKICEQVEKVREKLVRLGEFQAKIDYHRVEAQGHSIVGVPMTVSSKKDGGSFKRLTGVVGEELGELGWELEDLPKSAYIVLAQSKNPRIQVHSCSSSEKFDVRFGVNLARQLNVRIQPIVRRHILGETSHSPSPTIVDEIESVPTLGLPMLGHQQCEECSDFLRERIATNQKAIEKLESTYDSLYWELHGAEQELTEASFWLFGSNPKKTEWR
jgi:hypothetical protein